MILGLPKLKSLNIGHNPDLKSLTLPQNSIVFDLIDVSYTQLPKLPVTSLMFRCKKIILSGMEKLSGTFSVSNTHPLTYVEAQHTNIEEFILYCPTLETFKGSYNTKLKTVKLQNGAKNIAYTCGGVNGNVEVQLYTDAMARKWFEQCANNSLNDNVNPTYKVTTTDKKDVWVPVTSVRGASNLSYFVQKNIHSNRITVKGKDVMLKLTQSNVTSWFAGNYGEDNEDVHLEMLIYVGGTTKYCPITSLDGANSISSMASSLTDGKQLNITSNGLELTCYTEGQVKKWFETCDEEYGSKTTVNLRLVFKDNKTSTILMTKENYNGRTKMLNFCKRNLNYDQYGMSYGYPYIYLTDAQKEMWYGRAQVRDENNRLVYFNYSSVVKGVRISGYAYRPKK